MSKTGFASSPTRKLAVVSLVVLAAVFGVASPAHAWGIVHNGVYHGDSWTTNGFPRALTHHDNINGTVIVCAQSRAVIGPGIGAKVCDAGSVAVLNGTSYYTQAGGRHWGGSATSNYFES